MYKYKDNMYKYKDKNKNNNIKAIYIKQHYVK